MLTTLNTFNTTQKNVAVQARMRASAGPLFMLWKLGFGNILLRPLLSLLHSWPAVLLFHTPLPAVFLHSSRKCFSFFPLWFVDILRVFPVTRIELSLSDECNVNMSYTCSGRMLTWTRCLYDEKRSSANECRDAVPYWLLCTDKRTSVCLRGLHTLLVQSSICSHVKQELQET